MFLPAPLFADMGGALMAAEAVLKAVLTQKTSGQGAFQEVALAALEPHFAAALCQVVGVQMQGMATMFKPATHAAVAQFLAGQTRAQLDKLAVKHDLPLHTLG